MVTDAPRSGQMGPKWLDRPVSKETVGQRAQWSEQEGRGAAVQGSEGETESACGRQGEY